jgi:hypothetical protein
LSRKLCQNFAAAVTERVSSNGIVLPGTFLNAITNGQGGVLLVEISGATTNDLVLEIRKSGKLVGDAVLHLRTSSITNFYRHVNLRGVAGGRGGMPTRLETPSAWPDELTINKNFVFIHGYNVTADKAVGWNAETFKRLWWSGSKAKYYGVNWRGDESRSFPGFGLATPNYHINVRDGFTTATVLAPVLNSLIGETVMAGHSLGNLVASSAISDWNAPVSRYFMLNAAVPKEAYDTNEVASADMTHPDWTPYTNRLWASEWHKLFPTSDGRRYLTWRGRLANQQSVTYYNFYSSGEEVLQAHPAASYPTIPGLNGQFAWALQEKTKGRWISGQVLGSAYGGWSFNRSYDTEITIAGEPVRVLLPADQAASLTDNQLRARPFFHPGSWIQGLVFGQRFSPALFGATGSAHALANRDKYLAEAFPARTLATGVSPLSILSPIGQPARNFDMNATYQNSWPTIRGDARWLHSDLKDVANLYVYRFYDQLVTLGVLK